MSKRVRAASVLAVLLFSLSAIAQTPLIGPETPLWNNYRSSLRPGYKYTASAAGNADGFLATWCESIDQSRVLGARLTRDGKLAGAPFEIGVPPTLAVQAQADNDRYIVSSINGSRSKAWQVAPSGIAEIAPLPSAPPVPAVVHGSTLAFAWEEIHITDPSPGSLEYQRSLIYTTLDLTTGMGSDRYADATRLKMTIGVSARPVTCTPAAIFDGRDFVYAWSWYDVNGNAEVRVVNGYGTPRTLARHHDLFPYDLRPVLAAGTEHNLLLWHPKTVNPSAQTTRWDVLARAFDASSSIDDGVVPTTVTQGVTTQRGQSRALGPKGTFVTWGESSESEMTVRGRFVPKDAVAGESFVVYGYQSGANVSANASTFLVTMRENGPPSEGRTRIFVRRYDANGSPLDAQPVLLGLSDYNNPGFSVVSESDSFIVAWTERASVTFVAVRIPSRGPITVAPKQIFETRNGVSSPRLVRVRGKLVVLWFKSLDAMADLLEGAPVSDNFNVGPTVNMWLFVKKYYDWYVSVAFESNDQELMVVASGLLAGETQSCVRMRRYSLDLYPGEDPTNLECRDDHGIVQSVSPRVTWDGERWWVWDVDGASSATPIRLWPLGGDGKPQAPVQITDGSRRLSAVALWPASYGLTLSYERADDSAAGIMRAYQLPIFLQSPKTRVARH